MTKHQRTAGQDFRTVQIGEDAYKLRPLTIGHYAEMEAFVSSLRKDPLLTVSESVDRLPPKLQAEAWDAALRAAMYGRIVPASEIAAFENSMLGLAWKFWKCVEQDHPDVDSPEKALAIMTKGGPSCLDFLKLEIHVASGEADLGK